MAIILDNDTRLVVAGLTGSEGRFHGLRNRAYGTNLVAGVTPGKGGQDVEGVPIFDTVAEAVDGAGANTSLIFVPARFAVDAIYEAVDAGIGTVICITEHIPAHDMLRAYTYFRGKGTTMIGPNCPGVLSPGKANAGIIPAEIFSEGSVGLVSRSGTLTYQIGHELTQLGLGNSTIVGIGGDPVVGSSFVDVIAKFEADDQTELIVLVGEIGRGLLALVGVAHADDASSARAMARKIHELRIFPGADGEVWAADLGLPVLVVSQFTLYADTRKGRRPSWQDAAPATIAQPLVEEVVTELRRRGADVATGTFGARMQVTSVNDGPMTLVLEV